MTSDFTVRALDPDVAAALRVRDDAGQVPAEVVDADGGSPLRCCLRLSRPGERLLLASYAPLRRWAASTGADPAAYDEVGPIFLHAEACDGPVGAGFPVDLRTQPRVFRAYDGSGRIIGGRVFEPGQEPEPLLADLLRAPAVAFVHARAVVHGCFTFAVERSRVPA
jgi:hypothetical protein